MAEIIETHEAATIPTQASKNIDYGKALGWYLNDPNFGKILLTASLWFLSCILILPIFYVVPVSIGFMIELVRNIQADKWVLPEFGTNDQWSLGGKYFLWSLALGVIVAIIAMFLMSPVFFLGEDSVFTQLFGMLFMFIFIGFAIVVGIMLTYTPFMILAKTNDFNRLWDFNLHMEVFKSQWGNMLLGYIIMVVVSYALSFIGAIACYIGMLPATVVTYIIMSSIIGQMDTSKIV